MWRPLTDWWPFADSWRLAKAPAVLELAKLGFDLFVCDSVEPSLLNALEGLEVGGAEANELVRRRELQRHSRHAAQLMSIACRFSAVRSQCSSAPSCVA